MTSRPQLTFSNRRPRGCRCQPRAVWATRAHASASITTGRASDRLGKTDYFISKITTVTHLLWVLPTDSPWGGADPPCQEASPADSGMHSFCPWWRRSGIVPGPNIPHLRLRTSFLWLSNSNGRTYNINEMLESYISTWFHFYDVTWSIHVL